MADSPENGTNASLGSRIAIARRAAGLSQEKLGEAIGVSKGAVSYYESNTNRPAYDKLEAIADRLGVSQGYLLTGDERFGGKVISPEMYDLFLKLEDMPAALRSFVLVAAQIAEETKGHIPSQFLVPTTRENWTEFSAYLIQLAELLKSKPR